MPDKRKVKSVENGLLPLPTPSKEGCEAQYIVKLNNSLLSIGKLYENDCIVTFYKTRCEIRQDNKVILFRPQNPRNRLWKIPLQISEGAKALFFDPKKPSTGTRVVNTQPLGTSKGGQAIYNL